MELSAKYNPSEVEDKWYAYWLEHKLFHSEPNEKELLPFSCIQLPRYFVLAARGVLRA